MKQTFQGMLAVAAILVSGHRAEAGCLWPFGGWWGAGYPAFGAPAYGYGYYGAGYRAWTPYNSAGYYGGGCCLPSCCCDPCCGTCSGGSCSGTTSNAGSLKPSNDPNFQDRSDPTYERDRDLDLDRRKPLSQDSQDSGLSDLPNRRPVTDPASKPDDFKGGAGDDPTIPFEQDNERVNQKPPMSDLKDLPPADGTNSTEPNAADKDLFLPEEKNETSNPQASRMNRTNLALRSSQLDEVVRSKRLASRSVPAVRPTTTFAGRAGDESRSVRWISLPMPEGHARL